ncbi:MAG: hypothetical protein IKC06_04985 [Clostridia bacterium]|nr:hypothetical protein [Clostridia bacterium]
MKKNVMMRIASVLLVAVMLTTCVISGTFAKYVTSGESTDTARVAKWGVTITPNGTAFGTAYKSADGKISATYTAATDSVNHDSTVDNLDLVAPGTGDTVVDMTISGAPEVDVHVQYTATITLTGWTYDDDKNPATPEVEYCPIYFTIGTETYGITGTTKDALDHGYATVAELKAAVETAISSFSADYEANSNLSSVVTPDISWNWDYYSTAANDVKDTALGDKAAAGNYATITIVVETTISQID